MPNASGHADVSGEVDRALLERRLVRLARHDDDVEQQHGEGSRRSSRTTRSGTPTFRRCRQSSRQGAGSHSRFLRSSGRRRSLPPRLCGPQHRATAGSLRDDDVAIGEYSPPASHSCRRGLPNPRIGRWYVRPYGARSSSQTPWGHGPSGCRFGWSNASGGAVCGSTHTVSAGSS